MRRSMQLSEVSPELERLLNQGGLTAARFSVSDIECQTVKARMRDGVLLATDVYLPPSLPAPVVVIRTPYGRNRDERGFVGALLAFARRGFVAVAQDCRGTGESEPDRWDYYVFESEDGFDCIAWIVQQPWYGGFIGGCGASYSGQTQWCMATHPAMSAIVPSVSGLGLGLNTAHLYMFLNAYARSVGRGASKVNVPLTDLERMMLEETLAGGYFNEPLHPPLSPALAAHFPELAQLEPDVVRARLWEKYCGMSCAERARFVKLALRVEEITFADIESLPAVFGQQISHDRHTLPYASVSELCLTINSPPLMRTGWYDWALNDALETWQTIRREAKPDVGSRARLIIAPHAHAAPGYREGSETHPELLRAPSILEYAGLHLRWYDAVKDGGTNQWPTVVYYLMGANEWRVASDWPIPEARQAALYLCSDGRLTWQPSTVSSASDHYTYDPDDPTPTVGGSILSSVYPAGSVDVSRVQHRPDVLVYTTDTLEQDLDIVGPLRLVLFASSSARDTDFVARLSDVFPDGRAIQIQSGILRGRYREFDRPLNLEPGREYLFKIDMWATANRFRAGHRLRLDISSADFPHFDRNSNRAGEPGPPILAQQTIYRDSVRPSHLVVSVLRGER